MSKKIIIASSALLTASIFFVLNDAIINYLSSLNIQFYHFIFYGSPAYLIVPIYLFFKGELKTHIVCKALCAHTGYTSFSAKNGGCCGKTGMGDFYVRCVRMQDLIKEYHIDHIDFWSLDIEGGEMDALMGFNFTIPVHVFLIESVNNDISALLERNGFSKHLYFSPSRLNQIWINRSSVNHL